MLSWAMISMGRTLEKLGPALYPPDRVEGGSAKLNFRFTEFYEGRIAPVQTVRGRRGGEKAPRSIIATHTSGRRAFRPSAGRSRSRSAKPRKTA